MEKFNNVNTLKNEISLKDISCNHVFVLAGGQISDGTVNQWVESRLDIAIQIYKKNKCNIYCIGGGTYHRPSILNKYNHVIHESTSCAMYLQNNGVDYKDIKKEWSSYDTIGNGFFSFLNFIYPLKLKTIYLITSEFHMNRSIKIFDFLNNIFKCNINIKYLKSENNMDLELLEIRKNREEKSIKNFTTQMENINTIEKFFDWFYKEHNAYNSLVLKPETVDNSLKKSY